MGVLLYNKTYQRFPGFRNHLRPSPKVTTWVPPILPYVGRPKIYQEWSKLNFTDTVGNEKVPMVEIDVLICPSNPPRAEQVAPSDYVCNAGYVKQTDTAGNAFDLGYPDLPRNGVFLDHGRYGDIATPIVTLDYLNANDGSSNTLMLGENLLVSTWTHWQHFNNYNSYPEKQFMSFVWHQLGTGAFPNVHPERRINGDTQNFIMGKDQKWLNYARLASFHPQGVNVTFCDGHNRYLNESMDYKVLIQLMTPNGLESYSQGESPSREMLNDGLY
jgi:prepilin-type processing-associated H-X9-DG protein